MAKYYSNYYEDDYDDYYGGGYKKKSGGSYGSYGSYGRYGGFRWGSYGGRSLWDDAKYDEPDSDQFYVKDHKNYITPQRSSITDYLDHHQRTESNIHAVKEYARFFYWKMLQEKDYVEDKFLDDSKLTESEIEFKKTKEEFYKELWDKTIPGYTPLEQAIHLFKRLWDEKKGNVSGSPQKELDTDLNKLRDMEFYAEEYSDPIYNELMTLNPEAQSRKFEIINKIAMIKKLGSKFKVKKEAVEKVVPNSQLKRKKLITDFDQLPLMDLPQILMPDFMAKLVSKNITVNIPVDVEEHKQKIIIILDFSGSMHERKKQDWVIALMLERLRYAMKEEAEIFFSYFVHDVDQLRFTHIYNRETALAFWRTFSTHPSGGTTRVGTMVKYIKEQIEQHKLHNLKVDLSEERPEILVVNDGQDTIDADKFPYKVNALTLMDSANEQLKKLCLDTGGKYVYCYIDKGKDKVETYEKL